MTDIQLQTVSTIDAIRQMIEQDIYSLHFLPGDKIVESDLARRYGVSRNTLREAVAFLQASGILMKVPNKGVFVKKYPFLMFSKFLIFVHFWNARR